MLERFPSWDGIDPVRLLLLRCSCMRLERFPSSSGIDPVRLLLLRFSIWRLERFPSWGGIDPVRLLLLSSRDLRLERFPSWGGRVPFSARAPRLINTTRCGVPPNEMPTHVPIAVVAFQLRVPVPRRVSFSPQRTLQSAMSPVFV